MWLAMGDQVVIALDSNDDMKQGTVEKAFCERNLREVIMDRHGRNAPPTTDNGSTVIDGILGNTVNKDRTREGIWRGAKQCQGPIIGRCGSMLPTRVCMDIFFHQLFVQ